MMQAVFELFFIIFACFTLLLVAVMIWDFIKDLIEELF